MPDVAIDLLEQLIIWAQLVLKERLSQSLFHFPLSRPEISYLIFLIQEREMAIEGKPFINLTAERPRD
jgi:hypothetical protein